MSKRSNWCEFDAQEREYIKKRDKGRCVICGNDKSTQIMHIFLSRAKGGKGNRKNGCLGCIRCHQIIDNPIGQEQSIKSKEYMQKARNYLIEQEQITDIDKLMEELQFDKTKVVEEKPKIVYNNKCKECGYAFKTKIPNSSICHYYCKKKKINITKSTMACNYYRR